MPAAIVRADSASLIRDSRHDPLGLRRDDLPVYLTFKVAPAFGEPQKGPMHISNFGVKLQGHCRANGVACKLVDPGAPDLKSATTQHDRVAMLMAAAKP